jgi:CxxC motif-containing protein (DUF1111 family)
MSLHLTLESRARRHFVAGVLLYGLVSSVRLIVVRLFMLQRFLSPLSTLLLITLLSQQVLAQPAAPRHPLDAAAGKALFDRHWIPAPASTAASDGLGPFYNARACANCHPDGGRGADLQALVLRSSDPVYGRQLQPLALAGMAPELQYTLGYPPVETDFLEEQGLGDVATAVNAAADSGQPLERLQVKFTALRYGPLQSPWSARLAPSLYGVGLLQLVDLATLQALADPDDSNGDGISGRLSQVVAANGAAAVGRFGWKAELPDLLTQTASAFSLDLGLGSPVYPSPYGDCSEAQPDCLQQASGASTGPAATELDTELLQLVLAYLEALPAPASRADSAGLALFERIGCGGCHVPTLPSPLGPVAAYTDLLLHDLGQGLDDGLATESASSSEWRTAPLWGLRTAGRLLHDGRATTPEAAILWHAGEALAAREAFRALGTVEKRQLLAFLKGL